MKLIRFFKTKINNYRLRKAIRKANQNFNATGLKFFVLWYHGKPLVKSKSELKKLIAERYFQKGIAIQQLEKIALYKTR